VIGLKHRYGYVMGMSDSAGADPMTASGVIRKYDRQTGTRSEISLGRGRSPGEPVFVPASNAQNEDDGYLMTYVHDAATNTSRFVVLDAKTMDNEPVASIELPRVPSGFHGSWIPASVAN